MTRRPHAHPVGVVLAVSATTFSWAAALQNGLGQTPLMGFSTWNDRGCNGVTADYIKRVADALVTHGLYQLGYNYVNVDDCWAAVRDSHTQILAPHTHAFPNGMQELAAYVHSKGLKFGLYTDRGVWTCGARPGSSGYERLDARTFAEWGVDYLKVDSCNAPQDPRSAITEYATMRDALNATGRPIFLALCGWSPWYAEVGEALANSWRIALDLNGMYELWNTISINSELASYAGPGAWNDPDALVGSTEGARVSFLPFQSRTQFSLWAIMAAPLILGVNVLQISQYDLETYGNKEIIDVDQDPLGKQGGILWENCPARDMSALVAEAENRQYQRPPSCQQIWGRPLSGGQWAVAFINWAGQDALVELRAADMQKMGLGAGVYVRDLWLKKDLGVHGAGLQAIVPGDFGCKVFRVKAQHMLM